MLWRLASDGIRINGTPAIGTVGQPKTVEGVWARFGDDVRAWATEYDVPVELIVVAICTESRGKPEAIRTEPGYRSDQETPDRVSPGLMQTLISTARDTLGKRGLGDTGRIDRTWLFVPRNSIGAGTSYVREQFERPGARSTRFDLPKVACAYNAGSLLPNDRAANRWKMKQYPIGSGMHADHFVEWFNDCFRLFEDNPATRPSVFPGRVPSLFEQVDNRRCAERTRCSSAIGRALSETAFTYQAVIHPTEHLRDSPFSICHRQSFVTRPIRRFRGVAGRASRGRERIPSEKLAP